MGYWRCPKCAEENGLNSNACWNCGFQNYGSGEPAPAAGESPGQDPLEKQRHGILEDVKKGLEDGLEHSRKTLDRIARRVK